jgi:hypothetical protein
MKILHYLVLFALCAQPVLAQSTPEGKNRLVVLTDVGADPDDTMSLVRLFLYSDEIDIEGLVATTSVWKRTSVSPELIDRVIDAYEKVQPNLLRHSAGYPSAEELRAIRFCGIPRYGMEGVGEGCDSAGSDWIIRCLQKDDPRPLWVTAWGGVNTLAQALYRMEKNLPREELDRLVAKLRVYTISDQDDSGYWIRKNFPKLFYIVTPGDDYGRATWSAINTVAEGFDNSVIDNAWIAANIQQGHGPLGAVYPDVAYGMEGDTPAWLPLIPNGLNSPEHPDYGGWGGRYELYKPELSSDAKGVSGIPPQAETRPIWTNASDTFLPSRPSPYGRAVAKADKPLSGDKVTIWRWREDFQNDFAARMDWCVKDFSQANHPPVPVLAGERVMDVESGARFNLDATASTDPDGDSLSFLWFTYPEAGSKGPEIRIDSAENTSGISLVAPEVTREETAHIILKVTDKGAPPLSRYVRVIVRIHPRK